MHKIKIVSVVGARPNFVKIAPFLRQTAKHRDITNVLVHTGQHYTNYMSDVFLEDFNISKYIALNAGPAQPVEQMARIMGRFECILLKEKPDIVVVVGDVNSTLACALTAAKLNIKIAHIEAGLRSFDRGMTEEINRILTDAVSDYLFITEPSAFNNLRGEGIAKEKIYYVGNIMIDSLVSSIRQARRSSITRKLGLAKKGYAVLTLHRPSNVDDKERLRAIIDLINRVNIKMVYPAHPRAEKMLKRFGYLTGLKKNPNLHIIKPLGYLDFLRLEMDSKFVITDSGGIQEETTYLGIPCFTLRKNTERPITITSGTNRLIGDDHERLLRYIRGIPSVVKVRRPRYWDGKTASRIVNVLRSSLLSKKDRVGQ